MSDDTFEIHFCTEDPCPIRDQEILRRLETGFTTTYTRQMPKNNKSSDCEDHKELQLVMILTASDFDLTSIPKNTLGVKVCGTAREVEARGKEQIITDLLSVCIGSMKRIMAYPEKGQKFWKFYDEEA